MEQVEGMSGTFHQMLSTIVAVDELSVHQLRRRKKITTFYRYVFIAARDVQAQGMP